MDFITYLSKQFINYINLPYILTFIFVIQGLKRYFPLDDNNQFEFGKNKIHVKYIALIVGLILATPFYFLGLGESEVALPATEITKLIVSYAVATSLYELLLKRLFSILKIDGNDAEQINS